jgi:23S rRNA pseudouridine1911/1915/1917 synthase
MLSVVADATERLDRFLADQLQLSRTQAARLVADKRVDVNGRTARASHTLVRGDRVAIAFPVDEPPRQLRPAQIPLAVVFEDEHLAVIDKPAGLVVHPAPGHWDDTLVNALVARGTTLAGGAEGRPGIVHRLDRDTSGLMVIAKTDLAHRRLASQIAARRVKRAYAGLAWGHLAESPTVIEAPLARHPRNRKRMAVVADGRAARTDAYVVARFDVAELLRLELHTGRTHQIRVHLEHIGHPLVGDPVYTGGGSRRISGAARARAALIERATPRQSLHAAWLAFRHPATGAPVEFRSEWPEDLRAALDAAAGPELVAQPDPLGYLRFFKEHE